MRFMIAGLAAAVIGLTATGQPARAEEPAQAAAPSARQMALTRQYIDLMLSDQFEEVIREMIGDEAQLDPSLPAEDREFLMDLTAELVTDMLPQMIEEMAPVYAAAFTEEELEALVAFYDTEMGRSIAAKNVLVMPEANRAVMSVVPRMLDKMASRMCQHYACGPGELEILRREMQAGLAGSAPTPAPTRKSDRLR